MNCQFAVICVIWKSIHQLYQSNPTNVSGIHLVLLLNFSWVIWYHPLIQPSPAHLPLLRYYQFICPSTHLSNLHHLVCQSTCLYLPVYMSLFTIQISLFASLRASLSPSKSICLPVYMPLSLHLNQPICQSTCLYSPSKSACLPVYVLPSLHLNQPVCQSTCLSLFT